MLKQILIIAPMAVFAVICSATAQADESTPTLREHITSDAPAKTPQADNSVSAFFQVPTNPANNQATPPTTKKTSVKRLVWHVMDNMGVPMLVGKDNDMDPSISSSNAMPPVQVPTMASLRKMDKQIKHNEAITTEPATANAVSSGQAVLHKIPQSELEGVELPAPRDENGH